MPPGLPGRLFRPSLSDFLGLFLAAMIVTAGGYRLFGDGDPGTHVATGYWILENHQIPTRDPFSATWSGREWFAYEWLADLCFALSHRFAGWGGLVALSTMLISTAHVLLYRFLLRSGGHVLVSFAAVVAAAAAASFHWLARPHLFTNLLLVLWVICLEEVLRGRRKAWTLSWLPALAVLWSNLHGGYLLIFGVHVCYGLGALLGGIEPPSRDPHERATNSRRVLGWLSLSGGVSILATLVNPWGWRLPVHLLSFSVNPLAIEDFAPPTLDRAGVSMVALVALSLVGVGCGVWFRGGSRDATLPEKSKNATGHEFHTPRATRPFQPGTLLAFGMGAGMSFLSIRHVEILAIFATILFSDGVSALIRQKTEEETPGPWETLRRHEKKNGGLLYLAGLLAVALLAGGGYLPHAGFEPSRFPVQMVKTLKEAGISPRGPVFAPDFWGGYLIQEWPEGKVYVDGRWDMYGADFMARYAEVYGARPGWQERLRGAGVEWALLPPEAPLAMSMAGDPDWQDWARDTTTIAFRHLPESSP